jgi:hypothetical protein
MQGQNGELINLRINPEEDVQKTLQEFILENHYPQTLFPLLLDKVNNALADQDTNSFDESPSEADSVGSQNFDEREQPTNNRSTPEISYQRLRNLSHSRSSISLSPTRRVHRSFSFSGASPGASSPCRIRSRNQEFFDRMHDENRKLIERKKSLKDLYTRNYDDELRKSSFR